MDICHGSLAFWNGVAGLSDDELGTRIGGAGGGRRGKYDLDGCAEGLVCGGKWGVLGVRKISWMKD